MLVWNSSTTRAHSRLGLELPAFLCTKTLSIQAPKAQPDLLPTLDTQTVLNTPLHLVMAIIFISRVYLQTIASFKNATPTNRNTMAMTSRSSKVTVVCNDIARTFSGTTRTSSGDVTTAATYWMKVIHNRHQREDCSPSCE